MQLKKEPIVIRIKTIIPVKFETILQILAQILYVGANYLSWWFGRNMKILVNIIRLTDSPEDRILVIYGAGHSKLLNQLAAESQFSNVVDPMEVLKD